VVSLCERFGCIPSQLDDEDAEFLRMIDMVDRYRGVDRGE
jgi:hypothetical protein